MPRMQRKNRHRFYPRVFGRCVLACVLFLRRLRQKVGMYLALRALDGH